MVAPQRTQEVLTILLRALKLPGFSAHHESLAERAQHEGLSFTEYLRQLCEAELEERRVRRVARRLKQSGLPLEKTLATLELKRLSVAVQRQIPVLCEGDFVARADNVLAFGLPGRGKSHVISAIGHELVLRGHSVLFVSAGALVEQLLLAKRDLGLERALRRLDRFDVVILDDLGYIQQGREEMEVLFAFLSERYERKSVLITSNLVFSQWDRIFKDPMTTAAAIDRVVHHSVILELTGESYRGEEARRRNGKATAGQKSSTTKAPHMKGEG